MVKRQTLNLEQLVYLSERKVARYMGVTLKQYREERDALTEALGLTEKKSGIYHQRRERRGYAPRRQERRS
jgi:hypothetical protein